MVAIKKNSGRNIDFLEQQAQNCLFFYAEYTKRRVWRDLNSGNSPFTAGGLLSAFRTISMSFGANEFAETIVAQIRLAMSHLHNKLVDKPQYLCNIIELPHQGKDAELLLQSYLLELKLLRDFAFTYGIYAEDSELKYSGKALLRLVQAEKIPAPPEPFIKKDADFNDLCRFNYVGYLDKKQYFIDEDDQHFYIYVDALSCELEDTMGGIKDILHTLKAKGSDKITSFGCKNGATLQIYFKKTVKQQQHKDILTYCKLIIDHYQAQYLSPNGYLDLPETRQKKLLWRIYGKDNSRLDFEVSAIGLWLWDLIHIQKEKTSEAIKIVVNSDISHRRKKGKDLSRQLKRDLQKTRKIIDTIIPKN